MKASTKYKIATYFGMSVVANATALVSIFLFRFVPLEVSLVIYNTVASGAAGWAWYHRRMKLAPQDLNE